jgi:hypothetical protein
MGEVSLQGPEHFPSMAERRKINKKNIMLQHYDATLPTQQKPSNSMGATKNMDKEKSMDVSNSRAKITQKH